MARALMQMAEIPKPAGCSRGTVLPLTLVFTLLLALVSATAIETASLQFHMAGNDLLYQQALQNARAIALEITDDRNNFKLLEPVGHSNCLSGTMLANCDYNDLPDPLHSTLPQGVTLEVRVTREYPVDVDLRADGDPDPVPRLARIFEVAVILDGAAARLGSAKLIVGVAVPLGAGDPRTVFWREPGNDPL